MARILADSANQRPSRNGNQKGYGVKSNASAFRRYLITVLDNIKEGVALIGIEPDDKFPLLLANKAFHSISGYRTDCIGQDVFEFVNRDRHKFLRRQFSKIIEYKKSVEYTSWSNVPVGRRAFEVDLIPVINTRKQVKEIIIILHDITALAKLKEEAQSLRAAAYPGKKPNTLSR